MSSRTLLRSGWALKCNPMQACAPLCQQIAGACRWAAISVLPRAKLVGVVAASVCARVRRGRGPPHVRDFSCLRIDNYFAIVTRELTAATSCQRIAGFYRCFGGRYTLGVVMCGEGQIITCGVCMRKCGGPRCIRHSLTRLPGPCPGRFIRPMKGH
jgi:hypothetical protein